MTINELIQKAIRLHNNFVGMCAGTANITQVVNRDQRQELENLITYCSNRVDRCLSMAEAYVDEGDLTNALFSITQWLDHIEHAMREVDTLSRNNMRFQEKEEIRTRIRDITTEIAQMCAENSPPKSGNVNEENNNPVDENSGPKTRPTSSR